jgi:Na+:H+ antiporter, NhaC family
MKKPGLFTSIIPLISLIILMIINVLLFGDSSTGGPNQLALLVAAAVSAIIGISVLKIKYEKIEEGMVKSITSSLAPCLILLMIGSLIGIWIISGIVPTIIYYGLGIITPSLFLPVACLSCCIISLATGSSWTTSGTVGIALMAIGQAFGFPPEMVAGAVISGSYFGDKMSPLSDTTNLAPAMAGTDLFTHIKNMLTTTLPSIVIALIIFLVLGIGKSGELSALTKIAEIKSALEQTFNITPWLLVVPLIIILMVFKKFPALPTLVLGSVLAVITTFIFQQNFLSSLGEHSAYYYITDVLANGVTINGPNPTINELLSRGGMSSMLSTVWLIICAMVFGGALEITGMLETLANSLLKLVRGTGTLMGTVLASCFFANLTTSDQYIAIVLPGRMFRESFKKYNLHPKCLSRALEDGGTVTSVLIPWNSGGAFHASVLGVSTLAYAPYCFFNYLNPIISAFLSGFNIGLEKLNQNEN